MPYKPKTYRPKPPAVPRQFSPAEMSLRVWMLEHPGVYAEVAAECDNVTRQFVNMVAYGRRRSTDSRVENALKRRGCPMLPLDATKWRVKK